MATFEGFRERIKLATFDSDKVAAVKTAAQTRTLPFMNGHQVTEILGMFPFSGTKIEALEAMADHITDLPDGQNPILASLSFSSDRERAGQILAQAYARRAANPGAYPSMPPAAYPPAGSAPYPQPYPAPGYPAPAVPGYPSPAPGYPVPGASPYPGGAPGYPGAAPGGVGPGCGGWRGGIPLAELPYHRGATVAVLTAHRKWLQAHQDGQVVQSGNLGDWEKFRLEFAPNGAVMLISCHGRPLVAEPGGGVHNRAGLPAEWSYFTPGENTDNKTEPAVKHGLSLRGVHGKYLSGEDTGGVSCRVDWVRAYEDFVFIRDPHVNCANHQPIENPAASAMPAPAPGGYPGGYPVAPGAAGYPVPGAAPYPGGAPGYPMPAPGAYPAPGGYAPYPGAPGAPGYPVPGAAPYPGGAPGYPMPAPGAYPGMPGMPGMPMPGYPMPGYPPH